MVISGYKTSIAFSGHEIILLSIGLVVAFITVLIVVKVFVRIVQNYIFKYFGYYRIIIGILFLLLIK
jgi:undecaprenyl-diphosphatase